MAVPRLLWGQRPQDAAPVFQQASGQHPDLRGEAGAAAAAAAAAAGAQRPAAGGEAAAGSGAARPAALCAGDADPWVGPRRVLPVDSAPAVKRISHLSPPHPEVQEESSRIIRVEMTCVEDIVAAGIAARAADLALLMYFILTVPFVWFLTSWLKCGTHDAEHTNLKGLA